MVWFDVVIVGCGFAGAATAFQLSRAGSRSILIVDKEEVPGYHASGRNASLILQSVANPTIRELTVASRGAYEKLADRVGFEQHGSLLLGARSALEACRAPGLLETVFKSPAEARARVPLLEGHDFDWALETPTDGVMDIARLLQFYLEGARARGVEVWLDCALQEVRPRGQFELRTERGAVQTELLVNAAGAWASEVAGLAGASRLPLVPLKRHLFVLDGAPPLPSDCPFVWDLDREFYFRPESGGLLFCLCDETTSPSLEPLVEPAITPRLAEVILRELPAASAAVVRRVWSCFRTKAKDGGLVIGPDPELEGFFWVAGLGGHGVGTSWEVGRLAAQALIEGRRPPPAVDPRRFADEPQVPAST